MATAVTVDIILNLLIQRFTDHVCQLIINFTFQMINAPLLEDKNNPLPVAVHYYYWYCWCMRPFPFALFRTPPAGALNMYVPSTTHVPKEKLNNVSISPFEYFNRFDRFSTD